ncbi:hypothetical protein GCM10020219_092980 [Nonomuraea dietziae]
MLVPLQEYAGAFEKLARRTRREGRRALGPEDLAHQSRDSIPPSPAACALHGLRPVAMADVKESGVAYDVTAVARLKDGKDPHTRLFVEC